MAYITLGAMLAISVYVVLQVHSAIPTMAPEPPLAAKEAPDVAVKTFKPAPAPGRNTRATPVPKPTPPAVPPPDADSLPDRAIRSFNEGNYETAISQFSELARHDPRAYAGVGLSYYKLGDDASAAHFLEKSVGSGADDFQARKFLAFTYYRLDDLGRSLLNAQAALKIRSDPELSALVEKLRRESAAQQNYVEEATMHFKVIFDGYEHSDVSGTVLDILESAYNEVGASLGRFPSETVTVILYATEDFYDVTQMPDWSGGIYDGKIRLPVRGLSARGTETLRRVLYHEYVHSLIFSMTNKCPNWINEGLAMYLSGERRESVGQAIPLRSLESSFPRDRSSSTKAYAVSYSAVSHLIDNYGLYSFSQFLSALSEGEELQEAFSSAFYMSYNEFIAQWGKT